MAFDLDRYLSAHAERVGTSGDERIIDCFACGGKKKLYVNAAKLRWFCYKCGAGRGQSIVDFVREHLHVSEAEAFRIVREGKAVAHRPGEFATLLTPATPATSARVLPEEYVPLYPVEAHEGSIIAQRAIRYLRSRGLSEADFLYYRLGYCPDGRYRFRVIVPVTQDGAVVYFVARLFFGYGQRYLNPAHDAVPANPSTLLFNYDTARTAPTLQICEGVFDAMALGENAVALFGKQLHEGQRRLLEGGAFERIEVWLDPDAAREAADLTYSLKQFGRPVIRCELASGDPGELRTRNIAVDRYEVSFADMLRRRWQRTG